jgi:hypothetical protein
MEIRKATRSRRPLRIAVTGPTGGGKSYTALRLAHALCPTGKRVGLIDTENSSSSVYANAPNPDGGTFDFDVIDLSLEQGRYSPTNYVNAINAFEKAGYPVLVIDSISHAWAGEGGVLYIVDRAAEKSATKNTFDAWRKGTPEQQRFIDRLLNFKGHLIVTMRSKTEYVIEENDRGKKVPRKVGLSPVQRDGVEYEFDIGFELDQDHRLSVSKTRLSSLADMAPRPNPGADIGKLLLDWYNEAPEQKPPMEGITPGIADYDDGSPDGPIPMPTTNGQHYATKGTPDSLRAAFYAKWGEYMPSLRIKDGASKEEVAAREAEIENSKALFLQNYFKVSHLRDIKPDDARRFEDRLRKLTQQEFNEKADAALRGMMT